MADTKQFLLLGAAGVAAWWFYFRTPTATTGSATTSLTVPVVPDPNAITGANTVAGIQARTIVAARAPAQGLSVDEWGYFLNQVLAPLGKSAPDPMPLFTAASPGFDRAQKVTSGQYWAVMAPALNAQLGLSGLGLYWAVG